MVIRGCFHLPIGIESATDQRSWNQGDKEYYLSLVEDMIANGVMPDHDPREPWFLCYSHSEKDIDTTLEVVREVGKECRPKKLNIGKLTQKIHLLLEAVLAKYTSQEIVEMNREYTFFSWSVQGQINPIPVEKAEGVYFWDMDGKRYLDFSSQLMNTNIGHQNPKVVKAIQDQAGETLFRSSRECHRTPRVIGKKNIRSYSWQFKENFFYPGWS